MTFEVVELRITVFIPFSEPQTTNLCNSSFGHVWFEERLQKVKLAEGEILNVMQNCYSHMCQMLACASAKQC